jgi:cytoskeleton protein RodZ
MRSLGRILREEREKRRLSLDELVQQTRISRKSLEALEADNPAGAGGPFYFRSFAKQIARALNLDTPEWQEALASATAVIAPQPASPDESYTPRVAPLRPHREGPWRSASYVVSFVVLLIACSGLYAILDRFDVSDAPSLQKAASVSAAESQPVVRHPDAPDEAILLKIAAVEKTWLSVDTDGKHIYSGLLDAADTKELEGRVTARIRTGNAGGLTVTFNGRELGALGQRGQVRTVVFTRDQYRILAPSLTSRLRLLPAVSLPQWSR